MRSLCEPQPAPRAPLLWPGAEGRNGLCPTEEATGLSSVETCGAVRRESPGAATSVPGAEDGEAVMPEAAGPAGRPEAPGRPADWQAEAGETGK